MTKLRLLVILAVALVAVPLFGLLAMSWYSAVPPASLGVTEGKLAPCPATFNCVSTQAGDDAQQMKPLAITESAESAMRRLRSIVAEMPRARIITSRPDYLHAEYRSPLFRFVDDVEFLADPKTNQIHFRSASRVGISDLGVNRKRMEAISASFAAGAGTVASNDSRTASNAAAAVAEKLPQTDEQWRKVLTPEQFYVTRQQGTERAFSGEYWDNKEPGEYRCVCCDLPLFDSESKFDSGTGWPSFFQPVGEKNVQTADDYKLFWRRVEVHCSRCGAHLGHVFDDGPPPTGLRYCINSVALSFVKEER